MLSRRAAALLRRLPARLAAPQSAVPVCVSLARAVDGGASAPVAQARAFRSSSVSPASQLDKVLAREEKHEASSYEPSPEVQGPPPADFQVEDTAGDCLVKLVKTSGKETITVEVIADEALEHEEFEEEGEEEASPSVAFSVLVSKGDQSLAFTCLGQGDQPVQIQGVTLERDEEESTGAYAGPVGLLRASTKGGSL